MIKVNISNSPINISVKPIRTVCKVAFAEKGKDGKDGFSPIVDVTRIENGVRITVKDGNGTKTVDVMDGEKGDAFTYEDFTEEQLENLKAKALVLASGTDFDTVLTPDDYSGDVVLGDGTNSNYLNSPTAIAASFSLEVIPTGRSNQRLQRLTLCSKGYSRKWERHYHSGSWGEWFCTYADRSTVLWSGAELMEARDKVINLSERISKQPTGIELVFSRVENGAPVDYHFETKFVSKGKVLTANGKGYGFSLFKQSTPFSAAGSKYLYIFDDRIEGNANNALSGTGESGIKYDNSLWMLRQVNGV